MLFEIIQIFLFICFCLGIFNIVKKRHRLGISQLILSVYLFMYNFIFVMHRDWINGNETPSEFFIKMLKEGNINCIIIIFGILISIVLIIKMFKKNNNLK